MENFINELKSNACSKSDYESKINNEEITIFYNKLKESIKQFSLAECKKGNYVTNGNKRYICLRITIYSKFIYSNTISFYNRTNILYDIHSIQESSFGMFDVGVRTPSYENQHTFSNPLLPLCASIETYTFDHTSKINKLFGKHEIASYDRIVSNEKMVHKIKNYFIKTFGNNIDYCTKLIYITTCDHEGFVNRIHDLKIYF